MKKYKLTVCIIVTILAILAEIPIIINLPRISILDKKEDVFSEQPEYAMGRNIFGYAIFKNSKRADERFRMDYAENIFYMEKTYGREYSNDYDTLKFYMTYGWQTQAGDEIGDKKDLLNSKFNDISSYAVICMNGDWRTFFDRNCDIWGFLNIGVYLLILVFINVAVIAAVVFHIRMQNMTCSEK